VGGGGSSVSGGGIALYPDPGPGEQQVLVGEGPLGGNGLVQVCTLGALRWLTTPKFEQENMVRDARDRERVAGHVVVKKK